MKPSLKITVNGLEFENPFILASGPPGTNGRVIAKSYDLGWGGMVIKTISLDSSKVINTNPRYAKLRSRESNEVLGFQNIELISDRPFDTWLDELKQLKKQYPKKMLIASIMEEYRRDAWHEIVRRVQETGVDAFELNLSCPHGLPERKMGMAMGENPDITCEVVQWVKEVAKIPVWAKMTPNVGDPTMPAKAALNGGADGLSAINTILSVTGIDLKTMRPIPTVEGYSVPGGYSGQAVRPIALRQVMEIARIKGIDEKTGLPNVTVSGMGGIETGSDAIQFMLIGARTVQVCTAAMMRGYEMIDELKSDMEKFMVDQKFERLEQFVGKSLPFFTSHHDLVERQLGAKKAKGLADAIPSRMTNRDAETWQGDIAKETDKLAAN